MTTVAIRYYPNSNTFYRITNLVKSATWSGDVTQAHRTCEINLHNDKNSAEKRIELELGKEIRLYANGDEIFRGIIFKSDISHDGNHNVTVYDYNYYLTRNKDSQKFVKRKASQIIKSICKQYGVSVGQIDDTGYVIPKMILRDKTLYDMITIALTETKKKTGKVFLLSNVKGKLVLRERKLQVKRLLIRDGSNLLGASYSESIEDMRNAVRITGKSGEDAKGVAVKDPASIKKYGLMQEKQHDSNLTDAQLKSAADALLKELNKVSKESEVSALGDVSILAGKSVQVSEVMTGIKGGFYVLVDSHTFEANGMHTMSLTVSKTLELNELEYEPPSENTAKKASASSHSVVELARSFIGKLTYSFGGTNIAGGSGDCSAFTQYIFKKAANTDLGRDTLSQVSKGKRIATSEATTGDLVFFKNTYRRGVSHVGIVSRKGYCVSLASSGCKEHSYTSGYWGGKFMEIRRVT